jgi:pimeloyl-ACP methyl ester carboxylesterase
VALLLYATIGLLFYYFQDKILLHPEKLPRDHTFDFSGKFEERYLPMNQKDTVHVTRFLPDSGVVKGAVIYWHGNRKNVERYAGYTSLFTQQGYEVWMPDYPGFGKSSGTMNEKKLYQIADQVMKLVVSRFHEDSVIIYGKSFGTGPASYLASYTQCKSLILETPYYSFHSLLRQYLFLYPVATLSNYELPVWKFLDDTRCTVAILHGRKDGVVFFSDAEKLKKHLRQKDVFIEFPKGSHNDLSDYPLYKAVLDSVLAR